MPDVILLISVLLILLMFADQLRPLIAHAILNRTIRKAMEATPPVFRC